MFDWDINWKWWLIVIAIVIVIVFIILLIISFTCHRGSKAKQCDHSKMPRDQAKTSKDRDLDRYYRPKKNGKFCSKGEAECRRVLEKHFNEPFPNVRPEWLINPKTGRRLEIDCYSKKLKIGVEYDGQQHFKPTEFGGMKKVREQQAKDRFKDAECERQGVTLIRVPYTVKNEDIECYILERLPRKYSFCNLL